MGMGQDRRQSFQSYKINCYQHGSAGALRHVVAAGVDVRHELTQVRGRPGAAGRGDPRAPGGVRLADTYTRGG